MKKLIILMCLCSIFTVYAGNTKTDTKSDIKTSQKSVENVQTRKKVNPRGKTENISKWTNWSKIKDLFM